MGETSPLRKADLLRTMPDDHAEIDDLERGEPPVIPTRGGLALVSRDDAPVLTPPGAASDPSADPSSTPGARAPAPQAGRLSGFKLSKRRVDYTTVDQPMPAAKKRKEGLVVLLGTSLPAPAASPSVEKGSVEEARSRKAEEEKMKAREDAIKGRDTELEQSAEA
nr:D site-binding protein-like [Aegilops tauschii subsp. strangulata]